MAEGGEGEDEIQFLRTLKLHNVVLSSPAQFCIMASIVIPPMYFVQIKPVSMSLHGELRSLDELRTVLNWQNGYNYIINTFPSSTLTLCAKLLNPPPLTLLDPTSCLFLVWFLPWLLDSPSTKPRLPHNSLLQLLDTLLMQLMFSVPVPGSADTFSVPVSGPGSANATSVPVSEPDDLKPGPAPWLTVILSIDVPMLAKLHLVLI
ncbi:hypothetical protein EXN66_Car007143 [Channa argus]|uniref:Uncharacterized protein n=1 Tax=Channa argus TaxID=215402 RepID=A0A6G1PNA4_CHAAH|nr:hypothetical protein EXN66_Car007143 [Channa argus]